MTKKNPSHKIRVGMISLGCPKTLVDSEVILGKLDPRRYQVVPADAPCDVALINTCSFIHDAKKESIDKIFELIRRKEEGSAHFLIVLGCLVQNFPSEIRSQLSEVDAFIGTGDYDQIPVWIERTLQHRKVFHVGKPGYLIHANAPRFALTPAYSRYVKISEGCSRRCTFCTIPLYRGAYRSRSVEDIVAECRKLVGDGAREILLTGQDTTFFGRDTAGKSELPRLLRKLNQIREVRWIRLLYAYPSSVNDELMKAVRDCEKVCHYLDMPLQHASDKILKAMRRGHTRQEVADLIGRFRSLVPDLAIRTTFIVGFPGETERSFEELLAFVQQMKFSRLGVFQYSREALTPSAAFSAQVSDRVKRSRMDRLMKLQQKISLMNHRSLVGQTLEVLIERPPLKPGHPFVGRSYLDAPDIDGNVYVRTAKRLWVGRFYSVKITGARTYDLIGTV